MKGRYNCTGTVNVQGNASGRSKLIVQTLPQVSAKKPSLIRLYINIWQSHAGWLFTISRENFLTFVTSVEFIYTFNNNFTKTAKSHEN